jgi:hypothetical protein
MHIHVRRAVPRRFLQVLQVPVRVLTAAIWCDTIHCTRRQQTHACLASM